MAGTQLVHVGAHQVGHGLGEGTRKARKARGAWNVRGEREPREWPRVHVQVPKRVAITAGVAAATEVDTEAHRRHYNRKGANVSAGQAWLHPFKAGRQYQAATYKQRSIRLAAKGKTAAANRKAYQSTFLNNASKTSARGAYQQTGPYRSRKKYSTPETIGKSAFGVEHGRV